MAMMAETVAGFSSDPLQKPPFPDQSLEDASRSTVRWRTFNSSTKEQFQARCRKHFRASESGAKSVKRGHMGNTAAGIF
jgi:hypothetical protein